MPSVGTSRSRAQQRQRSLVGDRDLLPPNRAIDVRFGDFMSDQIGTVRRIYTMAGLELTGQAEQVMQSYIADHSRDRHGQLEYRLKEDFGLEPAALAERFRFYSDRFVTAPNSLSTGPLSSSIL